MPAERNAASVPILRFGPGGAVAADDIVAAEEPMEIRLGREGSTDPARPIAVTMRTPGDDFELAAGFLFGEGILRAQADVVDIAYCLDPEIDPDQRLNVVTVTVRHDLTFEPASFERNFYTTSSCGVCGKAAIEAVEVRGCPAVPGGFRIDAALIPELPGRLRAAQDVFERTGGLHAAGLFDRDGMLLVMREDVGRHNAVDKLVGRHLLDGRVPLSDSVLMLSGRASFELLQKAAMAGIPIVAAVGAPSSLAVEFANSFNITLAGFVRGQSYNVYSASHRLNRLETDTA